MEQNPLYINNNGIGVTLSTLTPSAGASTVMKNFSCPSDLTYTSSTPSGGSYLSNGLVFGPVGGTSQIGRSFTDGTSNTIIFAERNNACGTGATAPIYWAYESGMCGYAPGLANAGPPPFFPLGTQVALLFQPGPTLANCNPILPGGIHVSGAMNVGLGDGSVRTLSGSLTAPTFGAALTPASADLLGQDWAVNN